MAEKILIVLEEDLFLGNVINEKIKKEGFETLFINNARIALSQMENFKPDLVILDISLKTISSFKVLEEKNARQDLRQIPVITISPSGGVDEIRRVLDLGVRDYIVKSQFSADELVSKVKIQLVKTGKKDGKNFLEGRKIMWVEDDQFLSDLIARKLSQQKSQLLFSRTGEEALKVLEQDQPDVILLDLLLPGISGFDVLKAVKSNNKLKDIPVIILSNFTQNNEIERTRAMGADRFLTKATVVLDDIVKEIQNVLFEKQKI
ncbi:MAG: response regulator [Candidatus Paceibacterota bacterium]|nr:MAG: response regulator [Candidatus Paceibacterota bacterium]